MRVVICGGGIVGTAIAYYLAKRNIHCVIVEQEEIACAASGNAGGFLAKNWCKGTALDDLAKLSFSLHMDLSKELTDADYRCVNTYSIFIDKSKSELTSEESKFPLWVDGHITKGSLLDTEETTAQVHPKKLCQRLLHEAQTMTNYGTKVIFDKVVGIEFEDDASIKIVKAVKLGSGSLIEADRVVIAMGPWSSNAIDWFPKGSIPKVQGQRVHSAVYKIPQNVNITADCLFVKYGTSEDHLAPEIYPRPDGTVYVCGENDEKVLPDKASDVEVDDSQCNKLKEILCTTCSCLASAERLRKQACYLPNSPDQLPIIGKVKDIQGAYISTGHGCWGILTCTGTGFAMAELIATDKCQTIDLSPFRPERFY